MPSKEEIERRIEAPIQRSVKGTIKRRNKRAEAILRRLKKEEKNPTVKQGKHIKKTTTKAGGISSTDASFRTFKGETTHDLEFGRDNTPKGDPYQKQRKSI